MNPQSVVKEQSTSPVTMKGEYNHAVGKRKTSIASVRLYNGTGNIFINGKTLKEYFPSKYDVDTILSPLILTDLRTKVDLNIQVIGGGIKSQADAIRHGISKSLLARDLMLRPTLKKAGFITRDSRVKERKKPGLKRARRSPQWAKR